MCRRSAESAEVARRANDPLAEVVLPDAVDHDARRQRIIGRADPAGQFQPAAARGDRWLPVASQCTGEVPGDARAELLVAAPDVDMNVPRAGEEAKAGASLLDAVSARQRRKAVPQCLQVGG